MPEPTTESCLNCKSWYPRQDKFWSIGNCRFNPPVRSPDAVIDPGDPEQKRLIDRSVFPLTQFTDWCRKWEMNPKPPPKPVQPMSAEELEKQYQEREAVQDAASSVTSTIQQVGVQSIGNPEAPFKPKTLADALAEVPKPKLTKITATPEI